MKNKKNPPTTFEETILHHLFPDVFDIIAWDCTLTEPDIMREKLAEIVMLRLRDVLTGELAGFTERLSYQITCDLDLPKGPNLYGTGSYIPSNNDERQKLMALWVTKYKACNERKSSHLM